MDAADPAIVTPALLVAGWVAHALSWSRAASRVGRRAARPAEWPREVVLRGLIGMLLVAAFVAPPGSSAPDHPFASAFLLLFVAGHFLAVWARRELGDAWGIGTTPRSSDTAIRSGPYRRVSHPIYLGTFVALASQFVLLRNLPSALLLVGAALVIPVKIRAENRIIGRLHRLDRGDRVP